MADAKQALRRRAILEFMARDGRQGVASLARALGVTGMTIRRDLQRLEREGLLLRTHGGCVPQAPLVRELTFSEKNRQWMAEKAAIAKRAVAMLQRRMAVYLDTGTTAVQVARLLPADLSLRIFTPNLRVAFELFGRPAIETVVFGGVLALRSPDLVGDLAISRISDFRFDLAFLGADALDAMTGEFYATEQASAAIARAALRQTRRAYLLANSAKLQAEGLAAIGRLGAEIGLITDDGISAAAFARLRRTGAEVIRAAASSFPLASRTRRARRPQARSS
jgi:DeoR/GlpR family transcriptional regulator of sugar metabolism